MMSFAPGRPRSIADEKVALVVRKTLNTKPKGATTHWTLRSMAEATNLSHQSIYRIWGAFGLQPHRQKYFKLSTDPFFVEKVRDIVGLYLSPPTNAMVLCVDEKSQIQALDRTQPMLPMGIGYVEGVTHDYKRHGTTTLFVALDTASGDVITSCKKHHRHQEYLQFLKQIDDNVPQNLDIHLVVDNYATHKHKKVKRWLAAETTLSYAFYPDVQFLAQPGGNLVRSHYPEGHPKRNIQKCQRTCPEDRSFCSALQQAFIPVCLDCDG